MNYSNKILFGLIVLLGMSASEKIVALTVDYVCQNGTSYNKVTLPSNFQTHPAVCQYGASFDICDYDWNCAQNVKYRLHGVKDAQWLNCCRDGRPT